MLLLPQAVPSPRTSLPPQKPLLPHPWYTNHIHRHIHPHGGHTATAMAAATPTATNTTTMAMPTSTVTARKNLRLEAAANQRITAPAAAIDVGWGGHVRGVSTFTVTARTTIWALLARRGGKGRTTARERGMETKETQQSKRT